MIATIARILFAPFKPLFDWSDRRCAEMVTEAIGPEPPDFIEPPDETPADVKPEPEPVAQDLVSEIVFDAAASRLWDCGQDDLDAWEDERIPAYVERGRR